MKEQKFDLLEALKCELYLDTEEYYNEVPEYDNEKLFSYTNENGEVISMTYNEVRRRGVHEAIQTCDSLVELAYAISENNLSPIVDVDNFDEYVNRVIRRAS